MKSLFRPFPLPLTPRQKFYLFVLQGLGAGIIDGGANFGIAYASTSHACSASIITHKCRALACLKDNVSALAACRLQTDGGLRAMRL